jgi:hypothetical protein
LSYEAVALLLSEATTAAELLAAAQNIEHVAEHWQRERLGRLFARRYDEFKKR